MTVDANYVLKKLNKTIRLLKRQGVYINYIPEPWEDPDPNISPYPKIPPAPPIPPGPLPDTPAGIIDPLDGVKVINPINTNGSYYSLKQVNNLGNDPQIEIDADDNEDVKKITDSNVTFFRVVSRLGHFASTGKDNWTARIHVIPVASAGKTIKGIANAKAKGFLVSDKDFKNLEYTTILKVNKIKDSSEGVSIKIRGGPHDGNTESTICCEGIYPYSKMKDGKELYSAEATHPHYRFESVTLEVPENTLMYNNEKFIGLKLVCYNKTNQDKIRLEMYIDNDPIDYTTGKPKNNWRKVYSIEDAQHDTPTWGGKYNTIRVDQIESVDIHTINIREIIPPAGL